MVSTLDIQVPPEKVFIGYVFGVQIPSQEVFWIHLFSSIFGMHIRQTLKLAPSIRLSDIPGTPNRNGHNYAKHGKGKSPHSLGNTFWEWCMFHCYRLTEGILLQQ